MILIGDIACPSEFYSKQLYDLFDLNQTIFNGNKVICNLEGLIHDQVNLNWKTPVLFSHRSIIDALKKGNVSVAALSNNHTLDLPNEFRNTVQLLNRNEIEIVGAGNTKNDASTPIVIFENEFKIYVINACWDFLLYHQNNPSEEVYINTINEIQLLEQVKNIKLTDPEAKVIIYFHWNFDLEILPFPMYRQFSFDLIDNGVSLVVGAHSHCVQGGELYKDGCIVYGLGNFYLPGAVFANGQLRFPNWASDQMAIEWNINTNTFTNHWFSAIGLKENFSVKHIESSNFDMDHRILKFSPFIGLSDRNYLSFFIKNRRKKNLIPIFKNYKSKRINSLKNSTLKVRARFARYLAKTGVINWQN